MFIIWEDKTQIPVINQTQKTAVLVKKKIRSLDLFLL